MYHILYIEGQTQDEKLIYLKGKALQYLMKGKIAMAETCSPCKCIPYLNKCYCPPQNGIWITMPQCQIVPGQLIPVNNPCYDGHRSYWSYNFFIEASNETLNNAITSFAIPICNEIIPSQISIFEKLSGAVQYVQRPFELKSSLTKESEFKMAPEGFQFIIINVEGRYSTGVSAEYRIEIDGDYPEASQDIYVGRKIDGDNIFAAGSFAVPGCPPPDELSIIKNCSTSLDNGTAALNYEVIIKNTGGSTAKAVQLIDTIGYDGLHIVFGDVKIQPENIKLDVISMPSLVEVKGQLGDIAAGTSIALKYNIPVKDVLRNGTFEFTNIAAALNSRGVLVQSSCTLRFEAADLTVDLGKAIQDDSITFTVQLSGSDNYPASNIKLEGDIIIDEGLTAEVTKLGDFTAVNEEGSIVGVGDVISAAEGGKKIRIANSGMSISVGTINVQDIQLRVLNLHKFNKDCSIIFSISNLTPLELMSDTFANIRIPQNSEKVLVRGNVFGN